MTILDRKKPQVDLRNYYNLYLQAGLIVALLLLLVMFKMPYHQGNQQSFAPPVQETIKMDQVIQTKQDVLPPPPPHPPVPVAVPNDQVINDAPIDLNTELNLDAPLDMPPPPPSTKKESKQEEKIFVVVERMPTLIGGLAALQKTIVYPELARKAGIEGRVYVEFVVDEHGRVMNPYVVRGIGGGCDQEALKAVRNARFTPGMQRGRPVKVRYGLPVIFKLQN